MPHRAPAQVDLIAPDTVDRERAGGFNLNPPLGEVVHVADLHERHVIFLADAIEAETYR